MQQEYGNYGTPTVTAPVAPVVSFMDSIREQERKDGVRFTWNYWPWSKSDSSRTIVPLGVFYTPFPRQRPDTPNVAYQPLYCNKCHGVLNPFWYWTHTQSTANSFFPINMAVFFIFKQSKWLYCSIFPIKMAVLFILKQSLQFDTQFKHHPQRFSSFHHRPSHNNM